MTTRRKRWPPLSLLLVMAESSLLAMNVTTAFGQAPAQPTAATSLRLAATVNPNPPRVGDNVLDVNLVDSLGKPAVGTKVAARVEMVSMDMGTTRPAVQDVGGGHYHMSVNFSMAGPWKVTLQGGGGQATLVFDVGGRSAWKSPPLLLVASTGTSTTDTPGDMAGMGTAGNNMAGMDMGKGDSQPSMDMKPLKMPQLQEQGTYVVTGGENWKVRTGFGKNAGMVGMMSQMMVGGSGMEGMKMPPIKMEFGKQNYTEDQGDEGDVTSPSGATKGTPTGGDSMPGMAMGDGKAVGTPPAASAGSAVVKNSGHTPDSSGMSGTEMPGMTMPAAPSSQTPSGEKTPLVIKGVIASPKSGNNILTVTVTTPSGTPVAGAKVTSTVAMTSMDMGTTHPPIKEVGKGQYRGTVGFAMSGPWRITVKVTPPGGGPPQKAVFDFNVK